MQQQARQEPLGLSVLFRDTSITQLQDNCSSSWTKPSPQPRLPRCRRPSQDPLRYLATTAVIGAIIYRYYYMERLNWFIWNKTVLWNHIFHLRKGWWPLLLVVWFKWLIFIILKCLFRQNVSSPAINNLAPRSSRNHNSLALLLVTTNK